MVTKVVIRNNRNSPFYYLPNLPAFRRNREFTFKPGVNVIIGENGSGKTTLMDIIRRYLLVDVQECDPDVIKKLHGFDGNLYCGIDVYADYKLNTFRMNHFNDLEANTNMDSIALSSFDNFGSMYSSMNASTGEGVLVSINSLFKRIFSQNAKLIFDYNEELKFYIGIGNETAKQYLDYIKDHRAITENVEFTILMDEPDRNLDINNIEQIQSILSIHKENTQLITVIHNPLLITWARHQDHINIIEMKRGYGKEVEEKVKSLLKK